MLALLLAASAAAAPPAVTSIGVYNVTLTTGVVYAQGLTCLSADRSACGWGLKKNRTGYTVMDLTLDVRVPAGQPAGTVRPALLCVHGGAYTSGDSEHENCNTASELFASGGYAAFSINYRLYKDEGNLPFGWPVNCGNPGRTDCPDGAAKGDLSWMPQYAYPAVRDAKAAVRWIRAHAAEYDVDPDYITAYGGSAGGTTVIALGLLREGDYKDEITAAEDPTLASTHTEQSSSVAAVLDHWGSDWMARQLWLRGAAPNLYGGGNPPIAIWHGTADTTVPFATETARIVEGYKASGVPYAFFPIAGAGHGAWGKTNATGLDTCSGPACGDLLATPGGGQEDHIAFRFVREQLRLPYVPPPVARQRVR